MKKIIKKKTVKVKKKPNGVYKLWGFHQGDIQEALRNSGVGVNRKQLRDICEEIYFQLDEATANEIGESFRVILEEVLNDIKNGVYE